MKKRYWFLSKVFSFAVAAFLVLSLIPSATPALAEDPEPVGARPAVNVLLSDIFNTLSDDDEFPLWLHIEISAPLANGQDGEFYSSEKTVQITKNDLDKEFTVVFDDYHPDLPDNTDIPCMIRMAVFEDEAHTQLVSIWANSPYISDPAGYSQYYSNSFTVNDGICVYSVTTYGPDGPVSGPAEMYYLVAPVVIPVETITNNTDAYPMYLKVVLNNSTEKVIKIEENGTYSVDFGKMELMSVMPGYLSWSVYDDEACSIPSSFWGTEETRKMFIIGYSGREDTSPYDVTQGRPIPLVIYLSKVASSSVNVDYLLDLGTRDPEDLLAVNMNAVIKDDQGTVIDSSSAVIGDASDAAGTITFNAPEGTLFTGGTDYTVEVSFSQAGTGEQYLNWADSNITGQLGNGNHLFDGTGEKKIVYKPVSVDVKPDFYQVEPSSGQPVYARTWLASAGSSGSGQPVSSILDTLTDDSQFTAEFNYMAYIGQEFVVSSILNEDPESADLGWDVSSAVTSKGTTWYRDMQSVKFAGNGQLTLSDGSGKALLKPYEGNISVSSIEVPVDFHIPDGYYVFGTNGRLFVMMQLSYEGVGAGDVSFITSSYDGNVDSPSAAHNYRTVTSPEDLTMNVYLKDAVPGEYYLNYALVNYNSYSGYVYVDTPYTCWTVANGIKVTLTEDGRLLFADGSPAVLDFYFIYANQVTPHIDVYAEYPDDYDIEQDRYTDTESSPAYFTYSLYNNNINWTNKRVYLRLGPSEKGVYKNNVPEGASEISSPQRRFQYYWDLCCYYNYDQASTWTDKPVIDSLTWNSGNSDGRFTWNSSGGYGLYVYRFPDASGVPVADYTLEYTTGSEKAVWDKWESCQGVQVHLAEDGRLYEINDDGTVSTEPYVIYIRQKEPGQVPPEKQYESIKLDVKTFVQDGVESSKAFTSGDVFAVSVTKTTQNGDITEDFLTGTALITSAGDTVIELKTSDGSAFTLDEDARYFLSYGTFHDYSGSFDTGTVNPMWPYCDADYYYYYSYWDRDYPCIFTSASIDEEGYIRGYSYTYDGEQRIYDSCGFNNAGELQDTQKALFQNISLILPWKKTVPSSITQGNRDTETSFLYKPITDISAIKDKGSYMIVVQNQYDGKWYALSYNEAGGYAIELSDVSSFEDLQNGYCIDTADSKFGGILLTAGSVSMGTDSVSLKLKSGAKDINNKDVYIKMGSSNNEPVPLMSNSSGTLIIRGEGDSLFSVHKGTYATLYFLEEVFGRTEFKTMTSNFGNTFIYPDTYDAANTMIMGLFGKNDPRHILNHLGYSGNYYTPVGNAHGTYAGVIERPYEYNKFMVDIDTDYLDQAYFDKLYQIDPSYPGIGQYKFYILSDDTESSVQPTLKKYTLVKTFGDFEMTFHEIIENVAASDMIMVYTDENGSEWALDPAGFFPVATKSGANGYRTLTTVVDHELIPNNNSGTSQHFSIAPTEVSGDGNYVFATRYPFRKSRQNGTQTVDYMTMDGEPWTLSDNSYQGSGSVYILDPDEAVYSQADWDNAETYKMSVIRNGKTCWLGVTTDESGKPVLKLVTSEDQAVSFSIYSDSLRRYYSSAYGTDLHKYIKVSDVTEINANDEILIVYNDGTNRRIVGAPFFENVAGNGYNVLPAAPYVLDEYSEIDMRDGGITPDSRYNYRLGTDEYIKKPFAYIDPEDDMVIWAQGVGASATGDLKNDSATQRKFGYVMPLNLEYGNSYLTIKTDKPLYYRDKAQTNFFPGETEGTFYIRGGKSDAWLGTTEYSKYILDITTGQTSIVGGYLSYATVSKDERVEFEVYRRPATEETFVVEYRQADDPEAVEGTESKPQDTFTLKQKKGTEYAGTDYIFVGWTTDPAYCGYLDRNASANLYDYDDLSNVAAVKEDIRNTYSLLGDCNPEVSNLVEYKDIKDKLVDGKLIVYPVYAQRGFSAAVSANEGETMIIGASDYKDMQNSGSGTISEKEIWLGSINIEVYLDGVLWVPGGAGQSTIGYRRSAPPATATMYFAYHNDNAADLNIKFIAETVTAETLYEYMSSSDFSQTEPTEHYVINAVVAEQGGSEDGLKYRYNWMSEQNGGQLDNVKGGSTVKIYVTSKYQVKYYLDNDGTGYRELTGDAWQDDNDYTTPGTDEAVNAAEQQSDYVVVPDGDYPDLINRTPTNPYTFKDELIERGGYQQFIYKMSTSNHQIPIAPIPGEDIIGQGKELTENTWAMRNVGLEKTLSVDPESNWDMEGTNYGTGNTSYAFKGNQAPFADDSVYTYHLTLDVKLPTGSLIVSKIVDGDEGDTEKEYHFTVAFTAPEGTVLSGITYQKTGEETPTSLSGTSAQVTLKHGESVTFAGIPAGVTYQVTETEANQDGYSTEYDYSDEEMIIAEGDRDTCVVTNTKNAMVIPTGSLTVTKIVAGGAGETDRNFTFTIAFTAPEGMSLEGITYLKTGEETATGLTGTSAQVSLKHNESVTFSNIPAEVTYTVTEAEADQDGYTTQYEYSDNDKTILSNDTDTCTVTNTKEPVPPATGTLTVLKVVKGNKGETDREFTFTVDFTAPEGVSLEGITYMKTGDENATQLSGSTAEVVLKHNESVSFSGIPEGVTYEVTEEEADQDSYKTDYEYSDEKTVIEANDTDTCTVVNTKDIPEGGTTPPNTGVGFSFIPYIMMLLFSMLLAIMVILKKDAMRSAQTRK